MLIKSSSVGWNNERVSLYFVFFNKLHNPSIRRGSNSVFIISKCRSISFFSISNQFRVKIYRLYFPIADRPACLRVSVFAIHYDQSSGDKFPTPGGDPVDRPLQMLAQFPVIAGSEFADSDKNHLPAVVLSLLVAVKSRFAGDEVVRHG